jgi:hypothetical protein
VPVDSAMSDPAAELAAALRSLRAQAGSPSLRALAKRAGTVSHTTVADALAGSRVPSWEVVSAIVRACEGDQDQIRRKWLAAHNAESASADEDAHFASRYLQQAESFNVSEPALVREGGTLDWLPEAGMRRTGSVPGFNLEETLRKRSAARDPDASQLRKRITQINGQVCTMLAVDIAAFTRTDRDDEIQLHLRTSLYLILREALAASGIPGEQSQYEERGDGVVVIFTPDVAAQPVIDSFPERLRGLIRRHNRFSSEPARIQLRVAANIGPVYYDEHGFAGDDVVYLSRMLDAQPLRRTLSESGTELALIISDYVYEKLVLRRHSLADPRSFRRVRAQVKRTPVQAWMYLPDESPP